MCNTDMLKCFIDREGCIIMVSLNNNIKMCIRDRIPLDNHSYLYDTPGIINDHQMTHFIDPQDLKKIIPQSELRPIGFQLQEKQTIYFDGLGRIDYISSDQASFITYFSRQLKIHRTKTSNADALYNRHKRCV